MSSRAAVLLLFALSIAGPVVTLVAVAPVGPSPPYERAAWVVAAFVYSLACSALAVLAIPRGREGR